MPSKLVVMESPTKTKIIQNYLGKDFEVVSSNGHVTNLKTTGPYGFGFDVVKFIPEYSVKRNQLKNVNALKAKCAKSKEVYIATDPDREGEAIGWALIEKLQLKDNYKRVFFNEITKEAIQKAFKTPGKIDWNLVQAQETRRFLDRMIGFRLSKLLQKKIKSKSAGRVQSICLKILVKKELERNDFKKEIYWTVESSYKNHKILLNKYKDKKIDISLEDDLKKIKDNLSNKLTITEIKKSILKRFPFLPYRTVTLLQDAQNILGFSTTKTTFIIQMLYEGVNIEGKLTSLITYPRTDSNRLSKKFVNEAQNFLIKKFDDKNIISKYKGFKIDNQTNIQDAHEAIRISHINFEPSKINKFLKKDQANLYRIIYNRSLGCLLKEALFTKLKFILNVNNYSFSFNSQSIKSLGFLHFANNKFEDDKNMFDPLKVGDIIKVDKIEAIQHTTLPPSRYTETKIIRKLEKLGIGRPSTYSFIINTLIKRGYIKNENKQLVPQEKGIFTNQILQKWFPSVINEVYTSEIEQKLELIASGKMIKNKVLKDFWDFFEPKVEEAFDKMVEIPIEKANIICPKCNNDLVYRHGRYGKFIACSNFPKCRYIHQDKKIFGTCPKCELGNLVMKYNTKGLPFIGCSLYHQNNCTYIEKYKKLEEKTFKNKKDIKTKKFNELIKINLLK